MSRARKPSLDDVLRLRRERKRKAARLAAIEHRRQSSYQVGHIFADVTTDEPVDSGISYVAESFKALITGPKRIEVRGVFCSMLLRGQTVEQARLDTVTMYGV